MGLEIPRPPGMAVVKFAARPEMLLEGSLPGARYFAKDELVRKRVSLYIGWKGRDVLASDGKRGQWYYTSSVGAYYFGPYRSRIAAGRAYDHYQVHS